MNNNEIIYWNNFYKKFNLIEPSNFAKFIMNKFKGKKMKILDAGCGNGRDSYYLSTEFDITGVDSSILLENKNNCNFIKDDMIYLDKTNYDIIYTRFTFHSITNEQQETFIKSIKSNSYLCMETRSDKSQNNFRHYGDNHYRNLTNFDYIKKLLLENNFKIEYLVEEDNLALYKDENPICIRIIAKKY